MLDKARRVIRKYFEFIVTKIKILWEQRVFVHEDVAVKYILKEKKETETLVVVFSACTRKGLKARYNYVRTLNGLNCSRLYILDDYAKDHRGSYYMGKDFRFNEEDAVERLISNVIGKTDPKKIVFCGSSKGGYAALNFGMKFKDSHMVVGAPQYFLYTYLEASKNLDTLIHIIKDKEPEKCEKLDYYLREKIVNNPYRKSQRIYIHYSDREHTYKEHICHMLKDLSDNGYYIESDIAEYENHSDISYYFPDFLRKMIQNVICG